MLITVDVRRNWDAITQQTAETTPANCHSVLLEWRVEPPRVDAGVPGEIAEVIARVLTGLGEVAFRWSGERPWLQSEARVVPAPHRSLFERGSDWLTTSWPTDLVVTRSIAAAAQLFEHDWEIQGQTALVIDPHGGAAESAIAALQTRRDWRSFDMAAPVVALMAPAVDGDGVQLTTRLPEQMEEIISRLARAFGDAGIALRTS